MSGRLRRRFTIADREASEYHHLPFDVPPGTDVLSLELAYEDTGAIVDLGLIGPNRFRGWSGSERRRVDVTPRWATPGYLPGEIEPGEWNVILGLYVVPEEGVDVEVDWWPDRPAGPPAAVMPPRPERPPSRSLPSEEGRAWLACDFHAHSVHSDGELEIAELACLAAERGLDVLAVTDHNSTSHHPHLAGAASHAGITLLPGQEVTNADGHANCLGDTGWIDFRQPPERWLATANENGGLLSINHPLAGHCAWRKPDLPGVDLIEAWHWTWDRKAMEPIDWWAERDATPIGGSDFHRMSDTAHPGAPTTWVEARDHDVLAALAEGRVAISADPRGPVVLRHEDELTVVDGEGCRLVGAEGDSLLVSSNRQTTPYRHGPYLLTTPDGVVLALTP